MLDHLLWGVPDLGDGIRDFAERSGVRAAIGGRHPGVGTHNALLDLEADRYLEIIAPDPSQDHFNGFGLLLRDLTVSGLLTWAARTDDVEQVAEAASDAGMVPGEIVVMSRRKPDGSVLEWRLLQIGGHPWAPLMPFFIQWRSADHPSRDAPRDCRLESFSLAHPDPAGLRSALSSLGLDAGVRAAAEPALRAVVESSRGTVTLVGPPAAHPFGWLKALGFRMRQIRGSRYLAMPRLLGALARLLGKDPPVGYALGLEKDGQPLLTPYCPPWMPSMEAAVRAVVELKFGKEGVFRGGVKHSAWKDPSRVAGAAQEPSPEAIDATVAFCDYVYRRYGRFPAYPPPFRTVLGYQASHVDVEFYDRFYRSEALSETQRRHMKDWHALP